MRRPIALLAVLALTAAALTGLTAIASSATSRPATVKTATSSLGRIILDGKSRTLYPFEKDQHGKSACSGACAANWPPLLTKGAPKAAASARASLRAPERPRGATSTAQRPPASRGRPDARAARWARRSPRTP
jgi:predicted lipoprotein with Yx(FWY)xxD motif